MIIRVIAEEYITIQKPSFHTRNILCDFGEKMDSMNDLLGGL